MPPHHDGGQVQYIDHGELETGTGPLDDVATWMLENLHRPLTLAEIGRQAALSTRTLNRRFHAATGFTPLHWLRVQRVVMAQSLLEQTDLPIDHVAERVGFGSALTLRQHFARQLGTTPQAYRAAFGMT
ncbi:MAG: transcriptional regulator, AraC family [Amycolatopsis sp.]|nr:transcriptional regulator, AraC family [Amycolatopsis sp.]